MALQKTSWQPDTCECVAQLEWDDAQPENLRTHIVRVLVPCAAHTNSPWVGPERVHPVHAENVLKNDAFDLAHAFLKSSRPDFYPADNAILAAAAVLARPGVPAEIIEQAKMTVSQTRIQWFFDTQRRLRLTIPDITPGERGQLQAQANTRFGPGKVMVS